jgi:hypothetical protein
MLQKNHHISLAIQILRSLVDFWLESRLDHLDRWTGPLLTLDFDLLSALFGLYFFSG